MSLIQYIFRSVALTLLLAASGCSTDAPPISAQACFAASGQDFSEVLNCYRQEQSGQALEYSAKGTQQLGGVEQRRFTLHSQVWSPQDMVRPGRWQHAVDIYIPEDAISGKALLIVNNGVNTPGPDGKTYPPADLSEEKILEIVRRTRTIAISVSDVPNQFLTFNDDNLARREDSIVARSWALFLQDPEKHAFTPLHISMMEVLVKTMDLAEKELQAWQIHQFIAAGASKRAWAVWLAAIADPRISSVVSVVMDFMNMEKLFDHTYQAYGKSWPSALADYHREGITAAIRSENFDKLAKINDPLRYLNSAYAHRLWIPKYIVNAGNDEFFLPDNTGFYTDQLPGAKSLRVVPNAGHGGINGVLDAALIGAINRWQAGNALPAIHSELQQQAGSSLLSMRFSETPVKLTQWTAINPQARDFRFPCGIRYEAKEISLPGSSSLQLPLSMPAQGWSASFVEATFADGFVATTQAYVLPNHYPQSPPPQTSPGCKNILEQPSH